ncbi:MAG: DUF4358 domain-containing protein [Lawsonibacter sp.]
MKTKWMIWLIGLVGMLTLTACQAKVVSAQKAYEPSLVQTIAEAGAFSEELEELDGDTAFALYRLADYGLSREDLTDCAVLRSAGATCEEAAVLVIADGDQTLVDQAEQALKDYVQSQIDANRDYRPAEIPKLENALVDVRERTLLLVVANDLEAVKTAME